MFCPALITQKITINNFHYKYKISNKANSVRKLSKTEMFLIFLVASLATFLQINYVGAVQYTNVALVGGGMSMGGMGMGGMGLGGMGMGGMGMGMGGGFAMDKNMFNGGTKNMNDIFFNGKGGKQGGQFGQGKQGFYQGAGMDNMMKGQQGAFNGYKGGTNLMSKGAGYQGSKNFGKQGKIT